MATVSTAPFRRGAPGRIVGEPWHVAHGGRQFVPLTEELDGVDYGSTLRLKRLVTLDAAKLRGDCGLGPDTPLIVGASWTSTGTSLRRSLCRRPISGEEAAAVVALEGDVSGRDLATMVIVQTSVILPVSLKPESSLTAHLAGSVLYEEKETLRLDARSSMFPAEALDFGETLWAPRRRRLAVVLESSGARAAVSGLGTASCEFSTQSSQRGRR
jgi:hypothetical protein